MSAQRKLQTNYTSRVEWLFAGSLEVEALAQRPLDPNWAKSLAAAFDPDLIGFPVVCAIPTKGGEKYHVADGQHRVKAAMIALGDNQMIQCEVIRGLSLAQAAKIFRGRNTVRAVRNVDRFLVGLTAGDEECQGIAACVESVGLAIDRNGRDGVLNCISSLQWIYRGEKSRGNGKNVIPLKRTLGTVVQAWGKAREALNGDVVKGIGAVVLRHGDRIDYEALENRLRQFKGGATGLLGAGRGVREAWGGSVANGVATRVVREYNKARKAANKLPEWMRGQDDA